MTIKTVVLLDPAGNELARLDLAGLIDSTTTAVVEPPDVPKTLDWYRDTTKWLVAGAAATLVLGLGFFGETSNQTLRTLFTIAGAALLITLATGSAAHLWIIEFGKLWENRGYIDSAKTQDIAANEAGQRKYLRRIRWAYNLLLVVFCIGMAAFAVACASRMWLAQPKKSLIITSRPSADELLLTDALNGETWAAVSNVKGEISWKQVVSAVSSKSIQAPAADGCRHR